MQILNVEIDSAGKWRYTCLLTNGVTVYWKFSAEQTTEQLEQVESIYINNHQYDSIIPVQLNLLDHKDVLYDFIKWIKQNPTITFNQYNTYLTTKQWYDVSVIKYFILILATELATRKEIILSDFNESEILLRIRNWIVNNSTNLIKKVIGYNG